MNFAICIIAYNRLNSLKRVLDSVSNAYYDDEITLIISIDKSDTTIVEDYAKDYVWRYGNKRVITHEKNIGLRAHVLKCGDFTEEYDGLIVLEDDVSVAPSFYHYAKQCVQSYSEDERIAGISLYNFPLNYQNRLPFIPLHSDSDVYLMQCAQSWGQVWMKKSWKEFKEWYEHNKDEFGEMPYLPTSICHWPKSSWLKYHTRYCVEKDKYFVYPYIALSTNNGDSGTHNKSSSTYFQSPMLYGRKTDFRLNPTIFYDAFFENELLYSILQIDKRDLCLDFYGENKNRCNKRYWLTRKILPFKILKSFSLSVKPYEWNIINDIDGDEIFLYDSYSKSKILDANKKSKKRMFDIYIYMIDFKWDSFFYNKISFIKEKCLNKIRRCRIN